MVEFTQYALDCTGALTGAGEESRGQTAGGGGGAGRNHTVTRGTEGTTGGGGHLKEREILICIMTNWELRLTTLSL